MIDERKNIDQWFDEDWDELSSLKAMIGSDMAYEDDFPMDDELPVEDELPIEEEPPRQTRAQLQASKAKSGKKKGDKPMPRRGKDKNKTTAVENDGFDDLFLEFPGRKRGADLEEEALQEEGINLSDEMSLSEDTADEYDAQYSEELSEDEGEPRRSRASKGKKQKEKKVKEPKEKKQKEPKPPKPPREKRPGESIPFIVVGSFLVVAISLMLFFGYKITSSKTNLPNVYVGGNMVGGLTVEQTKQVLDDAKWDETMDGKFTVKLPGEISYEMSILQSGAKHNAAYCTKAAFDYGHNKGILGNLFVYLTNMVMPMDVNNDPATLDEAYIKGCMEKGLEELYQAVDAEEYTIDLEKKCIDMLKGAGQIKLDETELYALMVSALNNDLKEVDYSKPNITVTMPDFQKLHDELDKEPVDASYDEEFNVIDDVKGYVFDVEKAEKIWEKAELLEEMNIPLTVNEPEVTGESLRALLFRDVMGSQTTYYKSSSDDRINNINLAAGKINGLVLLPGEEFSYNDTIGQRTEEAGFRAAGAYDDGEVVQEVGGGICQVSSTLYSATLYARIETITRTNHYFKVDYLDYGMDATVSWPNPDFKFRNNTEYPIKIVAECNNDEKSITVSILGTDFDHYTCKLTNDFYTVTEDYSYDGKVYGGVPVAYSIVTYRTVYDADGNVVEKKLLNVLPNGETYMDVYYFHKENIIAGLGNFPVISGGEAPAEGSDG